MNELHQLRRFLRDHRTECRVLANESERTEYRAMLLGRSYLADEIIQMIDQLLAESGFMLVRLDERTMDFIEGRIGLESPEEIEGR